MIVIAALAVTFVFFLNEYVHRNDGKSLYKAPDITIDATTSKLADINNIDSDNDGLKDWEEVLWGTDPHNPDTDGDGTPDGAEVAAGRNPLVKKTAKVDDHFSALAKADIKSGSTTDNSNLTDALGRDVFAKYMQLRQTGLGKDPASQQQVISDLIASGAFSVNAKVFLDSDVKTKSDASLEAVKQYGNDLGMIFQNHNLVSRSEGAIVKDAISKNDASVLKELEPIAKNNAAIETDLLALTVPSSVVSLHKNLINGISKAVFVDQSLQKALVDPLVAAQGVANYVSAAQNLYNALQGIRSYMTSLGIKYNSNEVGAILKI